MMPYGMTKGGRKVHIVEEDGYVQARSLCNWGTPFEVYGQVSPEELCKDCVAIQAGRKRRCSWVERSRAKEAPNVIT
jgi:hypothetical protein